MHQKKIKNIQYISDQLVEQIVGGRKTAGVVRLGEIDEELNAYNSALVVGDYYQVYDSELVPRCVIRIVAMEVCRWDDIPERLWRGDVNSSAGEFRQNHRQYFNDPAGDFEFVAYYFKLDKDPFSDSTQDTQEVIL
jgi:uncharacterized protein YhfF